MDEKTDQQATIKEKRIQSSISILGEPPINGPRSAKMKNLEGFQFDVSEEEGKFVDEKTDGHSSTEGKQMLPSCSAVVYS